MSITLTYNGSSIILPPPLFGYEANIKMPLNFVYLDDGTEEISDEGQQYDKRKCKATFLLPADNGIFESDIYCTQEEFNEFFNSTARAKNVVMTLTSDCGVFLFGPDKGDSGPFTISMEYIRTPSIQQRPFKFFKCELLFTNVGSYPAYVLPTEVDDGLWTFGDVTKCLMPQNLFSPEQKYTISLVHTENSTAQYIDRGSLGDKASTSFIQQCNESKCAAILKYLTNTKRNNSFDITTRDYYFAFGADHDSAATYTVQLSKDEIVVRHINYESFEIDLQLKKV